MSKNTQEAGGLVPNLTWPWPVKPTIPNLQTVPVNKYLGHRFAEIVDHFDLLWGNVFSLRHLENILLPVGDLQRAVLQQTRREKTTRLQSVLLFTDNPRANESALPTGSHFPMSPVCSHPSSSSTSSVFSGSFRYPMNTFGPLMQTCEEIII